MKPHLSLLLLIGLWLLVLVDLIRTYRHRRHRQAVDRHYADSTYEDVWINGEPWGAVCYSAFLKRWAATWNMMPYLDDRELYIYASRDEAIAALAVKYRKVPPQ